MLGIDSMDWDALQRPWAGPVHLLSSGIWWLLLFQILKWATVLCKKVCRSSWPAIEAKDCTAESTFSWVRWMDGRQTLMAAGSIIGVLKGESYDIIVWFWAPTKGRDRPRSSCNNCFFLICRLESGCCILTRYSNNLKASGKYHFRYLILTPTCHLNVGQMLPGELTTQTAPILLNFWSPGNNQSVPYTIKPTHGLGMYWRVLWGHI